MILKQIIQAETGWYVVSACEGELSFDPIVCWGLFEASEDEFEHGICGGVFAMYKDNTPGLSVYDDEDSDFGPIAIAAPGERDNPDRRHVWCMWAKRQEERRK